MVRAAICHKDTKLPKEAWCIFVP